MKFRSIVKFITISLFEYTAHGIKSLTILAIAYFINSKLVTGVTEKVKLFNFYRPLSIILI